MVAIGSDARLSLLCRASEPAMEAARRLMRKKWAHASTQSAFFDAIHKDPESSVYLRGVRHTIDDPKKWDRLTLLFWAYATCDDESLSKWLRVTR